MIIKIVIFIEKIYNFLEKKYILCFIGKYNKIFIIKNSKIKNIVKYEKYNTNIECDFFVNKILLDNKFIYLINKLYNSENEDINNLICNFKFYLVEIKIDNKTYDITNILNNYYFISNKLFDNKFIKWLNINHKINILDKNYSILIIDNELNNINLSKNSYIELAKDNYITFNI